MFSHDNFDDNKVYLNHVPNTIVWLEFWVSQVKKINNMQYSKLCIISKRESHAVYMYIYGWSCLNQSSSNNHMKRLSKAFLLYEGTANRKTQHLDYTSKSCILKAYYGTALIWAGSHKHRSLDLCPFHTKWRLGWNQPSQAFFWYDTDYRIILCSLWLWLGASSSSVWDENFWTL